MTLITPALIDTLRQQFELDWGGIHGASHWTRVRVNGLRLAGITGANTRVIEYFAFLHDSRRLNDGWDPEHGSRAAEFAASLRGTQVELSDEEFDLLHLACSLHSDGKTEADVTVQCCWDADRLDLGRVGIRPHPERLCSDAAKDPELIEWAHGRSLGRRGAGA